MANNTDMQFTVNVPVVITGQVIEDIIVTALEGGIGYWACLGEGIPEPDEFSTPLSMRVTDALLFIPDYKLAIHDSEDPEGDELGFLSLQGMLDAIPVFAKEFPHQFSDLISGEGDAETADLFIQIAVLGEVTFG